MRFRAFALMRIPDCAGMRGFVFCFGGLLAEDDFVGADEVEYCAD